MNQQQQHAAHMVVQWLLALLLIVVGMFIRYRKPPQDRGDAVVQRLPRPVIAWGILAIFSKRAANHLRDGLTSMTMFQQMVLVLMLMAVLLMTAQLWELHRINMKQPYSGGSFKSLLPELPKLPELPGLP